MSQQAPENPSLALGVLAARKAPSVLIRPSPPVRAAAFTQAAKADVDRVLYIPAALASINPYSAGDRSAFGTGTELLVQPPPQFSPRESPRHPAATICTAESLTSGGGGKPLVCPVR